MASAASMNAVAVCFTEVADVRRPGLEDPQAEDADGQSSDRLADRWGPRCQDKIQCLDCRTGSTCPLGQARPKFTHSLYDYLRLYEPVEAAR
jgi:hypothetical protein